MVLIVLTRTPQGFWSSLRYLSLQTLLGKLFPMAFWHQLVNCPTHNYVKLLLTTWSVIVYTYLSLIEWVLLFQRRSLFLYWRNVFPQWSFDPLESMTSNPLEDGNIYSEAVLAICSRKDWRIVCLHFTLKCCKKSGRAVWVVVRHQ